jgi:DNA-binding phage protein
VLPRPAAIHLPAGQDRTLCQTADEVGASHETIRTALRPAGAGTFTTHASVRGSVEPGTGMLGAT